MRKFLSSFDLFPAQPLLRAGGDSSVVNLCSSIFSICIFGTFTYLFIDSLVKTVKLQEITATQTMNINANAVKKITNITVGIGLQLYPMTMMRNIFQARAFVVNQSMLATQIQTFPCTRQMWKNFNDEQYKNLGLAYHMCVQQEGVQIFGEFGTSDLSMLQVGLYACDPATSPVPCASSADIDNFFNTSMIHGRFLAGSFVMLDTGLNPTDQNPFSYRPYAKTLWMLFNQHQTIMGQVFFGTYEINTDTSFLPFVEKTIQEGYYVSQTITTSMVNYLDLPIYVQLYLMASPLTKVIDRRFGKVDEVLSYVGGLYGIVISFIGVCLLSFNEYKYELRVSQGAFTFKDGHLAREQDLNFGKYLKYVAFDWIKTFLCCEPNWKDCKAIDEARQEANEQIDVKHLLKRISHLEKVLSTVVSEQDEAVMFMAESNSLEQAKYRRAIVEYCEKFTDETKSITIRTFNNVDSILQLGLAGSDSTITPLEYTGGNTNHVKRDDDNNQDIYDEETREKNSFELMDESLKRFIENFKITDENFQLSQEDLQIQKNLTKAFYKVTESSRLRFLKKIPLGILYRIRQCKRKMMESHSLVFDQNQNSKNVFKNQTQRNSSNMLRPLKVPRKNRRKLSNEYNQNEINHPN